MAVIEKKIRLAGSKGSREVVALFDSGAMYSCVRSDLARQLEKVVPIPGAMTFRTAKRGETLTARERISVNIHINGCRVSDEFMVIPGLVEPVIIGAATMQKWRMELDFEHDRVIIDPRVTKLRLLSAGHRPEIGEVSPTAPDYKEEQPRPVLDPGPIRPILKADSGCILQKALTRVKFCTRNSPGFLTWNRPGLD